MELVTDLEKYFLEQINQLPNQLSQSWVINPYLAKVLTKYAHSDNYFLKEDDKIKNPWLFKLLQEAQDLEYLPLKKDKYQTIGDIALFSAIWFDKQIKKSIISPSYYIQVGQNAYDEVNNLSKDKSLLFICLSQNFGQIVSNTKLIF